GPLGTLLRARPLERPRIDAEGTLEVDVAEARLHRGLFGAARTRPIEADSGAIGLFAQEEEQRQPIARVKVQDCVRRLDGHAIDGARARAHELVERAHLARLDVVEELPLVAPFEADELDYLPAGQLPLGHRL